MWMTALSGKYVLHQQLTARFNRLQLKLLNGRITTSSVWTVIRLVFLWCIPPDIPAITIKEKTIERVTSTKLLGVIISNDLGWSPHITMIHGKAAQRLCLLKRAGVECIHIVRIYVSHVLSLLDYACQVRHIGLTVLNSDKLEGIQKRAMTIEFPELSYECAVNRTNINTIHTRREELYRHSLRGILSPTRFITCVLSKN